MGNLDFWIVSDDLRIWGIRHPGQSIRSKPMFEALLVSARGSS